MFYFVRTFALALLFIILSIVHCSDVMPFNDHIKTIHSLDDQKCIPRLLCELATTKEASLTQQERSVLKLFRDTIFQGVDEPNSPQRLYKEAAMIGAKSQNSGTCRSKFSACPLSREQLVSVFNLISASAAAQPQKKF